MPGFHKSDHICNKNAILGHKHSRDMQQTIYNIQAIEQFVLNMIKV